MKKSKLVRRRFIAEVSVVVFFAIGILALLILPLVNHAEPVIVSDLRWAALVLAGIVALLLLHLKAQSMNWIEAADEGVILSSLFGRRKLPYPEIVALRYGVIYGKRYGKVVLNEQCLIKLEIASDGRRALEIEDMPMLKTITGQVEIILKEGKDRVFSLGGSAKDIREFNAVLEAILAKNPEIDMLWFKD